MEKKVSLKELKKSFGLKKHGFSKKFLEIYNRSDLRYITPNKTKLKKIIDDIAFQIINDKKKIDSKNRKYVWYKGWNENYEKFKKNPKNLSNNKIDNIYDYGIKNGAIGGKLLGAGNGGFILFLVKKNNRKKFIEKFKKNIIVPVKIDTTGSQIIYYKN